MSRTTLELDEDVLETARPLAIERGLTLGQMISSLARQSLTSPMPQKVRNGVLLFTPKAGAPSASLELVNSLRDGE